MARDDRRAALVERAKVVLARVESSRVGRTVARYLVARGNLLAGGIAFTALFSIFAGLAIGYTAFMAVLGGNEELRTTVLDSVGELLPGIIDDGSGEGLIDPDELLLETAVTPASVTAGAVLVWSALRMMTAIRRSVRAMFGIVAPPENFAVAKVRDLTGFLVLALGVLVTSVLGIAASTLGGAVLGLVGVEGALAGWLLRALGLLLAGLVDGGVIILLIRLTAGVRCVRRDLFLGAGLGAVASGALRYLGASFVGSVENPLIASFAVAGTLLLWVNVVGRILLYVAAFIANPPLRAKAESPEEVHFGSRPNYVTVSDAATLKWEHQPITGTIVPETAPDPQGEARPEPYWGGAAGRLKRHRARRLERRAARLRRQAGHDDEDRRERI